MNAMNVRATAESLLQKRGENTAPPIVATRLSGVERSLIQKIFGVHPPIRVAELKLHGERILLFASHQDPRKAKWLVIAPISTHERLIIPRSAPPWILYVWGFDEKVADHPPDQADNYVSAGDEDYVDRVATPDDLERFNPILVL